MNSNIDSYPYALELVTDSNGQVTKVIIPVDRYLEMIEQLEDEGLLRAMNETEFETPMSKEEAIQELNRE